MSKKSRAEDGHPAKEGRQEDYSENESINVDFNSKLYYIYREVILLLLISFSQDDVSKFLFDMDNNMSLTRFFNKVGSISITEFNKVVWFSVNSQYYVSERMGELFFKKYKPGFLKSSVFNIIQASKSFSIIICRFLYTIIKTNQTPKGQGGGMDPQDFVRTFSSEKRPRESDEIDIDISELEHIIDNPSTYIVDNCETIEEVLAEPYLNLDNIDPTPDDFSDNPPPPPVAEDATNESKIGINKQPIRIRYELYESVLHNLNPPKDIFVSGPSPAPAPATTEPEKRKCSRFVLLAEAKLREQEIKLNEENKKQEIALQLAIKAKQELDEAISKAGGETYKGIKTIAGTFYPKDEPERIDIADSKLIPILAMKQKSIEQGVREMLMNNNIPNKVSAVSILAKLNIISASADINDDDNQGGGGHSNYNQYGNAGPNIPKNKKHRLNDSDIGKKVAVADVRESLEGIGAQNQCNAAIGSIKDIPRIKCYICGQLGGMPNMKTMECEHIFCVGLAAQYFGLLRATSFSEEQKLVLSILYAWAHRCCNQLKSNLSFMKYKGKPNENEFEFHEANAKELLRNIYGNTEKYDCEWVDKLIKKVYHQKQTFITARTAILGRYCRPLIEQINEVRTRLFHFSPDLFSFMSILKIAATTLVLLTGEKNETQLKLKSKETVPLCRLLLFKDLESKLIAKGRGRGRGRGGGHNGGGRKNNKIQYGGVFDNIKDSLTIEDIYNGCWGELMKFMIRTESMRPELPDEQIRPVDEEESSLFANFIIHYDDNLYSELPRFQFPTSCNNEMLVEVVNNILFGRNLPELPPYGQFYIVQPITMVPVLIEGSLGDTIRRINNPAGVVPGGELIISDEEDILIVYYPKHNGPGADKKETPETLNIPIFNLLALNHKINPYSLIVALLYDNVSAEEHSRNMLQSINVITVGFHITDEYKREHLSVTLLIMLLNQPTTPLPTQISRLFATQTAILDRINDKLPVDTSSRLDDSLKLALNAILLIVHPDELPEDDSKDDELIQDILSFIHCGNKNRLYIGLIKTLGITDVEFFKPPEELVESRNHDGKLDEADDGESVKRGIVPMEESGIVDLATKNNRIRNLLIVIGGVYLADNELDRLNRMMHQIMISEPVKIPNFSEKFDDFAGVTKADVPHIFVYLINLLIEEPESIPILNNIFSDFLVEKFMLFKPESPKSPMSMDDIHDSPDSTTSPRSDSTSSLPLSPSSNPAPHTQMTEESIVKIIESSLSFISSYSGPCIFDSTDLQEYIDYFNGIVLEDGYKVLLGINNEYNQPAINALFSIVPVSHGGRKTNKKKLTKRRMVQRRHDKQYSKKKRNTSSNKGKKRVSIKHKKSRTKHHDTRKRRK